MNRPRESLLTLFDPLFSGDPATPPPPPCRDVPSPDLGSDKENAAPSHGVSSASDNSITLTKFFNRVYKRPKARPPRSLPKGLLIDVGDAYASDDSDSDSDSDNGQREQHGFVVNNETTLLTTGREDEARDSPPRRPLADIALGDGGSSPLAMKKCPSPSPLTRKGTPSSSFFGSPSPFKLARPTPAPSSSPLASVINAINRTTTSRSPSLSPPSTPSAPRIAVTPAEPSSPSPKGRQLRPDTMLHASPDVDVDVDVDLQQRRISVDLQESMSVHFESASFDLLKDKIMFPENDSLDADVDMEMMNARAMKVLEDKDQVKNLVTPISEAGAGSENELDCLGMLEERLCDMNIVEEENDFLQNKDEDRDNIISTPPEKFSNCNVASQYFILLCSIFTAQTKSIIAAPQALVRQFIRPKNNKAHVPAAPTAKCNNAPPAPLLTRRNSLRPSISSALPMPASASTAAQATKKTMMARGIPARKPIGSTGVYSAQSQPPRPRGSVSTMTLNGVQRPPAPALANVAHSRAMSVPSSAASVRTQSQSQRNKQMVTQAIPSSFKVTGLAGASGLRRPSSLRAPTSRVGASGIAVPRASSGGVGASGARRVSISTSMAVDGGGSGGGRLGLTGANKMGPVKGDAQGRSASARMMRRV